MPDDAEAIADLQEVFMTYCATLIAEGYDPEIVAEAFNGIEIQLHPIEHEGTLH